MVPRLIVDNPGAQCCVVLLDWGIAFSPGGLMSKLPVILFFQLLVFFVFTTSSFAQNWYAQEVQQGAHDPTILRTETGYVMQSTNNMLRVYTSQDALRWTGHDRAMSVLPQWLRDVTNNEIGDIWAPDLYYFGGEYRSYYSGSAFGKNTSGIGFLSSQSIIPGSPGYGWTDEGEVVRSGPGNNYNAIDADIIEDAEGNFWMAFGSWWDGIRLIRLDENTGKQSSSDQTVYRIASRGGSGIEGPALIEHNGQYFLFSAWDICCKMGDELEDNTYKTAMGRANSVTGPYSDRSGNALNNGGGTILLQRYGRYYGPGGGEPFQDINRVRFAHHYYDANRNGSPTLQIRDLVFTQDNWPEMGQPFLGRYLSAEAEHGALTNVEITSGTASNGEYVAYINYADSKIRLPMNIPQAGEYLLRYRYANGGDAATHNVSINGQNHQLALPSTGGWGAFPEANVAWLPATLIRGGNFIEVTPGSNFAELDRIDFMRIVRDTMPGNGFDNGLQIRLNDRDELAIKDGGWALFENVITDSIISGDLSVTLKECGGGTLNLYADSRNSTPVSSCTIPSSCGSDDWTTAECSDFTPMTGIKDFYLVLENSSGELAVGNLLFQGSPVSTEPATPEKRWSLAPQTDHSLAYSISKTPKSYLLEFGTPGWYRLELTDIAGRTLYSTENYFTGKAEIMRPENLASYIRVTNLSIQTNKWSQ